jgi:PAS domain S-box-containing protein
MTERKLKERIRQRAEALFKEQQQAVYVRVDRLFAVLLVGEWIAGIVLAFTASPLAWSGRYSQIHINVWMAVVLGAVIASLPVYLALFYSGRKVTRNAIAVAQVLFSSLFIHLTGGRIETHFHIFGSLAFLSFYRDWRVLVLSSAVVAVDHVLRGLLFPQSVYGVLAIEPFRWMEHTGWVVFEDVFLIKSCLDSLKEMRAIAMRQAEVEETRSQIEQLVNVRTLKLQQVANIVEASSEAIIGQSMDGLVTSWNSGAERLFKWSAEQACGQPLQSLIGGGDELIVLMDETQEYEINCVSRDGTEIIAALTRSMVRDGLGEVIGVSTFLRDITQSKAAEKSVSEFYFMVSHELRTPLTSIRAALGLIEGGVAEGHEVMDLVGVARDSSDRLIRLINAILDLKKIESGNMELNLETVDCERIVSSTLSGLAGVASESSVSLMQEHMVAAQVLADPDKVTQVLTNLVANAIKFSPPDSEVLVTTRSMGPRRVRFSVIDNGPGIPAKSTSRLFGRFQQLDSSDTRKKGGTGLGLAISKAIVEMHNGTIGVSSVAGKGSTFWFELPTVSSNLTAMPFDDETLTLPKLPVEA